MDLIQNLLLAIFGSGVIVTSILFYRSQKRLQAARAGQAEAEIDRTDAETSKTLAEADSLTVSALGGAIEVLRAENARLTSRLDAMQTDLNELHNQVTKVVSENADLRRKIGVVQAENEILKGRLTRMREVLIDVMAGLSQLIRQVCDADMEPSYKIPQNIEDLLGKEKTDG